MKWWHIALGVGGLFLMAKRVSAAVRKVGNGKVLVKRKYGNLTEGLLRKIRFYADRYNVPLSVAVAMIDIESGFYQKAYNPNCEDGTREHGKRVNCSPYTICTNDSYWRHEKLKKQATEKAWFNEKWIRAVDKNNPELWGAFGFTQILPDVAWGYGYSPEKRNDGLFDVDANLNAGLAKMGRGWKNKGNLADLRSGYWANKSFSELLDWNSKKAANVIGKFIGRVETYEKMFNVPRVARMRSGDRTAYKRARV